MKKKPFFQAVTTCILAIVKPLRTIYEAPMVLQRLFYNRKIYFYAISTKYDFI